MQKILQSLPEGMQGELFTHEGTSVGVNFSDSQFEHITNNRSNSASLRLIKDGKMSIASSSKPNDAHTLLQNALASVAYGSSVQHDFPGAADYTDIELADARLETVDTKTMVAMAEDLMQALLDYDPRIKVSAGVSKAINSVTLQNTAGFSGAYHNTAWTSFLGGTLIQGDDMLGIWDGEISSTWRDDFTKLKKTIIDRFDKAKTIVPFTAGAYPVIFAPSQVSYLLRPFLASLNGKAIVRDISPWKEKMGEQLLDPRITLVDDGTLPLHVSSAPFDREGVPTRRNVLIEQGVVKQAILDLECAQALGQESTGNGSLGGPSTHHVLLAEGEQELTALIRSIEQGLLIVDTMGAWSGNAYSGNVSGTISLGYKIEKGEIVGRVKDCMFSINAFDHFRHHLIGATRAVENLGGATFPHVALDEVVIATK